MAVVPRPRRGLGEFSAAPTCWCTTLNCFEDIQLIPPSLQLESALDRFKTFYTSAHQGRLLDWRYQLFSLTLKARFPLGTKELSVSLFQAMVLFLFNDREESGEKLEWQEIKDQTGIGESAR